MTSQTLHWSIDGKAPSMMSHFSSTGNFAEHLSLPPTLPPSLAYSLLQFFISHIFHQKYEKKNCLSISHSISVHNIWRWEVNKCIIVIHLVKACTQIYYIIHGDVEMLKRRHSEWDRIYIVQNGILHELNYSDVVNHTLFFSLSSFPKCSCKN